jgi:hypothetical protein
MTEAAFSSKTKRYFCQPSEYYLPRTQCSSAHYLIFIKKIKCKKAKEKEGKKYHKVLWVIQQIDSTSTLHPDSQKCCW